jgi:hypothetical protein
MIFNYLLIILNNIFKKEKELIRDFSLSNFPLMLKGHLSFLLNN